MNPSHRPSGAPPDGSAGPKRSLILAGGGMRVAYQAGVVRALLESGLTFAHADGTSGGIMNLAMLLSGLSPVEMCDRWRTLKVRDFVSFLPPEQYLKGPHLMAMGDADGIVKKVFPHLGIDCDKIRSAHGMVGTFNVCNYARKTNEAIPHDRVDLDLLVAGISLPIFMPPVQKGPVLYLDSVWIKDANLMEAVRRGADELWVVWCIGNTSAYQPGVFNQYVHMIELSANGALLEEFDRINEINARIRQGEAVFGHRQPITLHVIKPESPLPLDPDLYLGRIDTATLIDMGYADAHTYLRQRRPEGVPLQPEATTMSEPALGLMFRETMAGGFALGETDPRSGASKGLASGTTVAMHATVHIRDLKGFCSDPNHRGHITGHLDFTPFGANLPAKGGAFSLFTPTKNPKLKLMVYELAFQHQGQDYYLAGRKEVEDGPVWNLWRDTTTLYTQLHQGRDKTGPVVGAGVLTLGVGDLMRLLSTVNVMHAPPGLGQAKAVASFARFFLGELWDTYMRKRRRGDSASGVRPGVAAAVRQDVQAQPPSAAAPARPRYDAIVIGSGFGGAVTACRLAEKGLKVLVLERGRRWDTSEYPRKPGDAWIWDQGRPERRHGWLDFRIFDDMAVAQGAGVGGGSLIYANVSIEPKKELFNRGWPAEITYEELAPYFANVTTMLNLHTLPETQLTERYRLMKEAAEKLGYGARFRPVPLAVTFNPEWNYNLEDPFNNKHSKSWTNAQGQQQGTCVHCGNCDIGCQVKAKNTLDLNYLPWAERHGAEIRPLHIVRTIEPETGGYRVSFDRIENGRLMPGHESAVRVIVSAGSLGSTELLLRCRDQYNTLPGLSRFLGYNWSSNGDFLTPAFYDHRRISASQGPTIDCAIDFLDGSIGGERFFVEDGGFMDFVGNFLEATLSETMFHGTFKRLLNRLGTSVRTRDPLNNVMPWFGQAIDAADGTLYLGRSWLRPWRAKLKLDWDVSRSEAAINAMVTMHKRLSEATGGRPWVPPSWRLFKNLVTPHPLGGCNMGTTPENGVVDHRGEVFRYRHLYVVDGAIIPEAIGLNPSKTIAALAERTAALMD